MRQLLSNTFHALLRQFRYVRELYDFKQQYDANCNTPPGHFYSPVINHLEIHQREKQIWPDALPDQLPGIDLNLDRQLQWVETMKGYYPGIPYPEQPLPGHRYYYENVYYSYNDAIMLYTFYRKLQPRRVIEIGSGFSSAAMLDARDQLKYPTKFTFIDPFPERLQGLLTDADKHSVSIITKPVQEVALSLFEGLQAGDILFIDSSHVLKTGSDVQHNLFHILPRLQPGVYIHFHDAFWPFEYPKNWVLKGTNWNELYALRSLLMHNNTYSVECFSHYLHSRQEQLFADLPNTRKNWGGNLWLRKLISDSSRIDG